MMHFKVPTLLRFPLLCGIVSLFVVIACQKKEEQPTTVVATQEQPYFHKGVGGPIDSATANHWKRNLAQRLNKSRSVANITTVYYFPARVLQSLINVNTAIGVLFYYGQDSLGNVHLIPIGIDDRDYQMATATVVTTAGSVSWKIAKEWRDRFKHENPDGIWGHFWGSIAIERLLAQGTELVRVELGSSDEGAQKIMFSNAAIADPSSYEDLVRDCPPYCGKESNVVD